MKKYKTFISVIFLVALIISCTDTISRKIGSCYLHEDGKIKYLNRTETGEIDTIVLDDANAVFFTIISDEMPGDECVNGNIWAKDKLNVWFQDKIIKGCNPSSFEILENGYSKDTDHAFYYDKLIINADIESFVVLSNFFAKDENMIIYKGNEVFGVENTINFDVIDGYFSRDSLNIYFNSDTLLLKIPDSDAETFQSIDQNTDLSLSYLKYYTDKDKVYCIDTGKNIGDEDFLCVFDAFTESYELLSHKYYSKDNFNLYFKNRIIENADRLTFKPLGNNYALDRTHIFFKNKIMEGVDLNTFRVFEDNENFDARDANNYYLKGKKIKIELESS